MGMLKRLYIILGHYHVRAFGYFKELSYGPAIHLRYVRGNRSDSRKHQMHGLYL